MEKRVYQQMAAVEADHWWFRGRRRILERIISRLALPEVSAKVLEIGCGTGGNLGMLRQFGTVDAVEPDAAARRLAMQASGLAVLEGALPDNIPAAFDQYDLIVLLDVLEHIENDTAALSAAAARLAPGGHVLLTVPAFPRLWSAHDVAHHHQRRYTRASLRDAIASAGLEHDALGFFNMILFPPAAALRLLQSVISGAGSARDMPTEWLNGMLYRIFACERHLVLRLPLPFGLSLFAIARNPK